MSEFYLPLKSDVGIQRDGTAFDSTMHLSGSMTRFYRGRPQKIGGWRLIQIGNNEIVRTIYNYDSNGFSYLYLGRQSTLSYIQVFPDLASSSDYQCTPIGFVSDIDNNWVMSSVTYNDPSSPPNIINDITYIVASCAKNLNNLGNTTPQPIYYGQLGFEAPLVPIVDAATGLTIETAGTIAVVSKFLVGLGAGGVIFWNDGADFTTWPENNFVQLGTSTFIYSATVRSSTTPAILAWSLNSVALGVINQAGTGFDFSFVSTRCTILSVKAVASLEPCFYWVGTDSFWIYNGVVQELANNDNKKWFFDNINPNETGKTYATVNTQWNEIWFFFCKGTSDVINWAIVYQIDSQRWYDTDQINRSAAIPSGSVISYPIMASSAPVQNGGNLVYPLYAHEIGFNQIQFGKTTAITASIESRFFNVWETQPDVKVLEIDTLIPDIVQTGQMFFYVNYMGYPNSKIRRSENFTFNNTDEFKTVRIKGSIFSIVFVSNVLNGNFVMGNTQLLMKTTDDQRPGPTT